MAQLLNNLQMRQDETQECKSQAGGIVAWCVLDGVGLWNSTEWMFEASLTKSHIICVRM